MPMDATAADDDTRSSWRGRVINEARRIEDDLATAPPDPAPGPVAVDAAIRRNVECAREAASRGGRRARLRDWITGASFDSAWSALYEADELMTLRTESDYLRARTPDLVAALEANLRPDDGRLPKHRKSLESCVEPTGALRPDQRAEIRSARRAANTAAYVSQGVVRRWRNLLLAVGTAVFA